MHNAGGENVMLAEASNRRVTYMHHLWVTPSVRPVKEVEHILLKLFAVLVNIFPCLFGMCVRDKSTEDDLNEPFLRSVGPPLSLRYPTYEEERQPSVSLLSLPSSARRVWKCHREQTDCSGR